MVTKNKSLKSNTDVDKQFSEQISDNPKNTNVKVEVHSSSNNKQMNPKILPLESRHNKQMNPKILPLMSLLS